MAADRFAAARVIAVLAALVVLGVGCGTRTEPAQTTPDRVRVGGIVGIESLFLQFALDRGFFDDEGLDVHLTPHASGSDTVLSLHDTPAPAPTADIAVSHVAVVLLAREDPEALVRHVEELELIRSGAGLPFQMIGAAASAAQQPEADYSHVMVDADSPLTMPADLDGRTIAVDNSSYITEVAIRRSLENVGVDDADLHFVEMHVVDMMNALRDGRADAIHVVEPIVSIGRAEGLRSIIAPYAGTQPGLTVGSYVSSDEFIDRNPGIVRRFVMAVHAAGQYVAGHPDEFREAIVEITDLDPEIVGDINLPSWDGAVDVGSVELVGDLLVRYGLLDRAPTTDEVVHHITGEP